ncbi:VWA domain-containing protein [Oleiharenicola lentus]|uniref:VWA domain-containing protein n=1 Tax=Oleiharenicola lentus TaxID=2508720 RepID=UPI003F6717C3
MPLLFLFLWELARHTTRVISSWPKIPRAWAGAFEVSLGARHTTADTKPRIWLWFGLALCIVALARPQWGVIQEQVFDQSREVLIAVDLSKSMLAQDVKPSRLDRSKLLIQSLLDGLKGERVGLLMFAGTAFLQSPLSADYEILREFLPSMNPDYLPEGGSNYKAMLETSIQAFGTSTADRYLIILSDGESTTDDWKTLADSLKQKGIRVIGLGVGTAQGSFIPDGNGGFVKDERGAVVMSRLSSATLQELAQLTGGAYTDASAWIDLSALLKKTVEAGQKGEFSEKNTARMIERFQWFLAPGLLLLFASFWTEFPVRPRERALPIAGAKKAMRAGGAAVIGFLMFGASPRIEAADEPGDALVKPLTTVVSRLSEKSEVTAKDYSELAQTTLTYAQRLKGSQQSTPETVVRDALQGVDAGEKLDAKAADWPRVRKELEELLKKEEKSEEEKKQDEEKQKQDQQKQDQQNKDQQQQQKDQEKNQDQQQSDQQKQDQQNQPGEQQDKDGKDSKDAFGDMKDDPNQKQSEEKKPQPQPQSGTQKVGGQQDKKAEGELQDPNLAIPLQKLEQVRNQDSPAKLQQIMQGQQKQPAQKGKDW